mgnify:CR=1 FL=1
MASVSRPRRLRGRRLHLGAVHKPLRNAEVETLLNIGEDLKDKRRKAEASFLGMACRREN